MWEPELCLGSNSWAEAGLGQCWARLARAELGCERAVLGQRQGRSRVGDGQARGVERVWAEAVLGFWLCREAGLDWAVAGRGCRWDEADPGRTGAGAGHGRGLSVEELWLGW